MRVSLHLRDRSHPPQEASQYTTAASIRASMAASMTGSGLRKGMTFSLGGLSRFFSTFRKHPDATDATPTRHAPRHGEGESAATAALVHAANATCLRIHTDGLTVAETGRV